MRPKIQSEDVRKEILESFASSLYPGDARLIEAASAEDPEAQEYYEKLEGKSWQELLAQLEEIDGPDLYWYCWIYTFFTPEAFFYCLPAFLIVTMDAVRVDMVADHLIWLLDSPERIESDHARRYGEEVMHRVIPNQRVAIQAWVRYMLEKYPESLDLKHLQHWLG